MQRTSRKLEQHARSQTIWRLKKQHEEKHFEYANNEHSKQNGKNENIRVKLITSRRKRKFKKTFNYFTETTSHYLCTRNTLDCDQSNVYSPRVVFSAIS